MLVKTRIKRHFSRAAASYDGLALFQQKCGERLLQAAFPGKKKPGHLLDIGSGTGRWARHLAATYPRALVLGLDLAAGMVSYAAEQRRKERLTRLYFCQAEAERLPCPESTFDMVISNLTYQWVEDLPLAFAEVFRVLRPGGSFCFTTLGKGSLEELSSSFAEAHRRLKSPALPHGQDFIREEKLEEVLRQANFSQLKVSSFPEHNYYPDVVTFLKWLKDVGANNARQERPARGGYNPKLLREMIKVYEGNYRGNGNIPVSFRVVLGQGKKE